MMRTLKRNTQKMYYATYVSGGEPIYKLDENGAKIISYVDNDGNIYYEMLGETQPFYDKPVLFYGNIALSGSQTGGQSETTEFGLNLSDYSAVLVVSKGSIPIDEQSIIWFESEPKIDEFGHADIDSADYNVVKVSPSLNVDKYVLRKRV